MAFDASCEEMWLAWRYGACLVPAPRRIVRAGAELGPWLLERGITVVSTVPTLAALWPSDALARVRLLIFGGEACPPELVERLAAPDREVWNTYGPTEATVVACAAPLVPDQPVRIGLPLHGWQLAVVDPQGNPVRRGETGELVIGGAGLGRYLDAAKDAEKYRPVPALGWTRAYHSGDLVSSDDAGLLFVGRADDQVKLGGRRIELGEIDAALLALPRVTAAAAAVKKTKAGGEILVGYLAVEGDGPDLAEARAALAERLPAALVPVLAVVDTIPTRTSGKVDRKALPWPPPGQEDAADAGAGPAADLPGTAGWLARAWTRDPRPCRSRTDSDFFALGGNSLADGDAGVGAARAPPHDRGLRHLPATHVGRAGRVPRPVVARRGRVVGARRRSPEQAMDHARAVRGPRGDAGRVRAPLGPRPGAAAQSRERAAPSPVGVTRALVADRRRLPRVAERSRQGVDGHGRGPVAATRRKPGSHPRGGRVHLQLWACERLAAVFGVRSLGGTRWAALYARAVGCRVGRNVDLRTTVPVTGWATLGAGCAIEPETDLAGWWIEADTLHVGPSRSGKAHGSADAASSCPGRAWAPGP